MRKLSFDEMERICEEDLIWFFCHSEAACGIQSNWGAMVSASMYGGSNGFHDHTNSYLLNSVGRRRQIQKLYNSLSESVQNILFASFADVQFSEHVLKVYKKFSGSACCTSVTTPKNLTSICQRINLGKEIKGDKQTVSQIRTLANKNYHEAVVSYVQAKYQQYKKEKDNE